MFAVFKVTPGFSFPQTAVHLSVYLELGRSKGQEPRMKLLNTRRTKDHNKGVESLQNFALDNTAKLQYRLTTVE